MVLNYFDHFTQGPYPCVFIVFFLGKTKFLQHPRGQNNEMSLMQL